MVEIPGNVHEGAFYHFPKCSHYFDKSYNGKIVNDSNDLAIWLLEVAHVACVGSSAFGAPNCICFSYAADDELVAETMRRVKVTLA